MRLISTISLITLILANALSQNIKVPTLSPFTEISQEVGLTEISISYSRSSAKGRAIFGELVPYNEVWRTGANASTKLTFTEDVKIGNNPLVAGTYALYTIPGKDNWTIIIHKNTKLRSIAGDAYKQENDAFRFVAEVINNPLKIETFTIHFADITSNTINVAIAWENTMVKFPIEVEVDSKVVAQIAELMDNPDNVKASTYFRAVEYYFHNNKSVEKSEEWILTGLEKSPKNFRYGLLYAKILNGKGDKEKAITTIQEANQWARDANNANYIGQTQLFMDELNGN